MDFMLNLYNPPLAERRYDVIARGYMAASLYLVDANGPLADWITFAHLPLDISGRAACRTKKGLQEVTIDMIQSI